MVILVGFSLRGFSGSVLEEEGGDGRGRRLLRESRIMSAEVSEDSRREIGVNIEPVVLYVVKVAFSNSVQVGTVLFTTADIVKRCWTESDKSLLKARFVMQDVLPDPDCIDFSKPEASIILLDYFHACYQIIGTSTYGKLQNLMYLALSDALGGYLRTYVLPYTRRAYYSGQIHYSDAKKLFQLYDDIRFFLRTNGMGWAEPRKIYYRKLRAKPLIITGGALEACNQLYTIEAGRLHCINDPCKCPLQDDDDDDSGGVNFSKNSKENLRETLDDHPRLPPPLNATSHAPPLNLTRPHRNCENIFHRKSGIFEAKRIIVPLPVLDDCCAPNSIAVPFRRRPLRNLCMRDSAYILEYYYVAVIKCFVAKGNTRTDIKHFNGQFHAWLVSQVFPRLSDEKWYPAFGGVLRVMETIRKFGAESTAKDPILHDIAFMFGEGVAFDVTKSPKLTGKEKVREAVDDCGVFSRRHYMTAVLLVSLIWLFIFCACAFYCQATRGRNLLYEGRSERSEPPRVRREPEKKFINFEFLVRFFKRQEDCESEEEVLQCSRASVKENAGVWESLVQGGGGRQKAGRDVLGWVEQERKQKERGRLVMAGEGDVPLLVMDELEKVQMPFQEAWGHRGEQMEGEREGVQTLWRKPSKRVRRSAVKDEEKAERRVRWSERGTTSEGVSKTSSNSCSVEEETRGSSSEKRSSRCCCSEDCQHSNSEFTKSSSQSQVEGDLSSGTMEFFERVVGRHKKSSTQESTSESESEGEESYSSESDY